MQTAPSGAPATLDRDPVLIDLALQGGGSHGAFTWGVLDRLLEEPWLRIEAISGTSAGAMNAAVLADGWTEGGAAGARAALDAYWERVARAAMFSPLQRTPLDRLLGRWTLDSLAGLRRLRPDGAGLFALRPQSTRLQSAGIDPRREHRFHAAGAVADQAVHHGDQRPHRPRPHLSQRRDHAGRSARLGLPADACSRRSRSTARPTGTAAMPAIPRSPRSCARATRRIRSWCRSIRASVPARRDRRARSSTA